MISSDGDSSLLRLWKAFGGLLRCHHVAGHSYMLGIPILEKPDIMIFVPVHALVIGCSTKSNEQYES